VNVFSNDASLLKPVEALEPGSSAQALMYVVLGWPQTIASTGDPNTNFSSNNPTDLRAFLTLVGTRDGTRVTVKSQTRILGGGAIPDSSRAMAAQVRFLQSAGLTERAVQVATAIPDPELRQESLGPPTDDRR